MITKKQKKALKTIMKQTISTAILILACTLFQGCIIVKASQPTNASYSGAGTGKDITRSVKIDNVTEITSTAVADIVYVQGQKCRIELSGSAKNIDNIIVETKGSKLSLREKEKKEKDKNSKGVRITITAPALTAIDFAGVGDISLPEEVTLKTFRCTSEGVGDIPISDLHCDELYVDSEGVGDVCIDGNIRHSATVNHSGVGDICLKGDIRHSTTVNHSGVGDTDLDINTGRLTIKNQGVGDIRLSGNADDYDIDNKKIGTLSTSRLSR